MTQELKIKIATVHLNHGGLKATDKQIAKILKNSDAVLMAFGRRLGVC